MKSAIEAAADCAVAALPLMTVPPFGSSGSSHYRAFLPTPPEIPIIVHSSGSTAYPKPGKHFVDLIQSSRTKCALYFSPLVKYKLLSKWSNHGHERWMVRLRTSLQPFLVPGSIVSRLDISVPHSVFEYGLRPRFHTMGLTLGLASTICSGSTIVFPLVKQWPPTPNDVIRSLRAGNITTCILVPILLDQLVSTLEDDLNGQDTFDLLAKLRVLIGVLGSTHISTMKS